MEPNKRSSASEYAAARHEIFTAIIAVTKQYGIPLSLMESILSEAFRKVNRLVQASDAPCAKPRGESTSGCKTTPSHLFFQTNDQKED